MNISFNKHHNYESSFPHELIQFVNSICILIKGTSAIATDVWFYFIMNKFNVNCQTILLCEVSFTSIALFSFHELLQYAQTNQLSIKCYVFCRRILLLESAIRTRTTQMILESYFQPRQFYSASLDNFTMLIFSLDNFTVVPRQFSSHAYTIFQCYFFSIDNLTVV